ncbi:hypothetical protein BDF14DRAFT_647272 [Spinellus fusiger]|nr:hypothetical protein BDF14DRAFT_647272 [Spinellus fusiger]
MTFCSAVMAIKLILTKKHRMMRCLWTQEHGFWMIEQWNNISWSDTSHFCLGGNDGCQRVIRMASKKYSI